MTELRLVDGCAPLESPTVAVPRPRRPGEQSTREPARGPGADEAVAFVPAKVMLALAGRCSCPACCVAYAAGEAEPHDPRRAPTRLRAV